jgi:O-antigen/teichoic acid export membrane protein
MKRLLQIVPSILILVGALMVFQQCAYAYTDPGTGLLAVQAVGSVVVAAGWYLRRKIYSLFHRGKELKHPVNEYSGAAKDASSQLP